MVRAYTKTYDIFLQSINFHLWVDYVKQFIKGSVVDLGCGTGSICQILKQQGYDVLGIDIDPEMIRIARKKCKVMLGDIRTAKWKADSALLLFDTLNLFMDVKSVKQIFKTVYKNLNSGGVFVFDILTKHRINRKEPPRVIDMGALFLVWTSEPEGKDIRRVKRTLFSGIRAGFYKRADVEYYEKGYDVKEIREWLKKAGFKDIRVYQAFTRKPATRTSNRVFFVARKK